MLMEETNVALKEEPSYQIFLRENDVPSSSIFKPRRNDLEGSGPFRRGNTQIYPHFITYMAISG